MDAAVVTPPYLAGPLRLVPFRALRLSPSRIGDPGSARTFSRPFGAVAERLERWRERGFITQDEIPALYLHEYTVSGITIRGLVGGLDVSRRATRPEQRAVLPHEGIYPAQADELADRMSQMAMNPAPILLVQYSPAALRELLANVRDRPPDHDFVDRAGQAHRLWVIADPESLNLINTLLGPTTAVIADGHHRYAAYLRLQQRAPSPLTDHGLAMLVDQGDTPLFLGAIHRVLMGSSVDDVAAAAASLGLRTEVMSQERAVALLGPTTLVASDQDTWLVVHLEIADGLLEVEILHEQLVPALGHGPRRITFHHTVREALGKVGPGIGTAVLMPAPSVEQVQRIVTAGRVLPEKATSFQPKPAFGVLIRSMRDAAPDPTSPPPRLETPSLRRS